MNVSTTALAGACSRHAGRTLAAWGVVLVGSIAALAFVLTGFTTEATGTNNPESERADERPRLQRAFRARSAKRRTDLREPLELDLRTLSPGLGQKARQV